MPTPVDRGPPSATPSRGPAVGRTEDLSSIAEESARAASSIPSPSLASPKVPPPPARLAQAGTGSAAPLQSQRTGLSARSRISSFVHLNALPEPAAQSQAPEPHSQVAEIPPQGTGMQPQTTGLQPQTTGIQPQRTGLQPQTTGMQPQRTGHTMRSQHTGFQPQTTGMQPQPTGLTQHTGFQPQHSGFQPQHSDLQPHHSGFQPQYTGFQPQHTGVQPQHTGVHAQPTGFQSQAPGWPSQPQPHPPPPPYPAQSTGLQPQQTGVQSQTPGGHAQAAGATVQQVNILLPQGTAVQPQESTAPVQAQRTGASGVQLPSAMKAQKTGTTLRRQATGTSVTPLRRTTTDGRTPVPVQRPQATGASQATKSKTPAPLLSQRTGSILLNPIVPQQPVAAHYTGPVQAQPPDKRPVGFPKQPPSKAFPALQAQKTGPRRSASMYAGTPAPHLGYAKPGAAWIPPPSMPLRQSKTGPVGPVGAPPPMQPTRTGWGAPGLGPARQPSRDSVWTKPMGHHRTVSDNRFDNWRTPRAAPPGAPPGNSLHLTGVTDPQHQRQRSVSYAPSHPDVVRRKSERRGRQLHTEV